MLRYLWLIVISTLALLSLQASSAVHSWVENSALSEGRWVKIMLDEPHDGIYQITYSQLKSWGFTHPEQVGVYGFGGHELSEQINTPHIDDLPEVAIWHDAAHHRILFYGQSVLAWKYQNEELRFTHRWNNYSSHAYYFLHEKSHEAPLSIVTSEGGVEAGDVPIITSFDAYLLHEQNIVNIGQTGKEWFGESLATTRVQKFAFSSEKMLPGTSLLTLHFVASGNSASHLKVTLSGQEIASAQIAPVTTAYTFANDVLINAPLKNVTLEQNPTVGLSFVAEAQPKLARLNYIRLQGKRMLEAAANEPFLLFRSTEARGEAAQFQVANMTSSMQVWEVTNPLRPQRCQVNEQGVFVDATPGMDEYALVNTSLATGFPGVSWVGEVKNQNLHAHPGANLIIVTAPAFQAQAEELAAFRRSHNQLSVLVVTPEEIYNEYSSGTPDASAIRLFLKQMFDRQQASTLSPEHQLRYLLLMGDGSTNNRENGLATNRLLTFQSDASIRETNSYTSDDFFGCLTQDNKLDIGIGRLPVRNASEASALVKKLISYGENRYPGDWKHNMIFVSDDDKMDASGHDTPNLHMRHNEQLITSLQGKGQQQFDYKKIYLPAYQQVKAAAGTDYPDARKELLDALQQGALLVNFAGHGTQDNITHEQIMSRTQAEQLRSKHLPLWVLASCDVCRWDHESESMGEALLLNPNGGAIGVIGAARVVYASNNLRLNQALIDHLFDVDDASQPISLGDLLKRAKLQVGNDYNQLNYMLLGDPSMPLALPQQQLVLDQVQQGPQVTLSGRVLQPGSLETDTQFHGVVYATILGEEDSIVANKGLWQEPALSFKVRNKRVFSGSDYVRNGNFAISFTVPADAGRETSRGLVQLYACSEEGAEALGFKDHFSIQPSDTTSSDHQGPEIKRLFLDTPSFTSGDRVGSTPYFFAEVHDASGFNTTGNSIGHDITLTLRSLSNPMLKPQQWVLNSYFHTLTGQPTVGQVQYSLPSLDAGQYEATFRLWDAYNNPTTQTFLFVVDVNEAPHISLMQAYPSPVRQGENVTFRLLHNRPESNSQLHLQIYTETGIKVLDQTLSNQKAETLLEQTNGDLQLLGSSKIEWKATVPRGIYMYRIFMRNDLGETQTKAKKLLVY